jgi:hypothetical protein
MMEDDFNEDEMFQVKTPASSNPLAKYFRVPGLNITLPSGGNYLPKGSIELTLTGEVPVFPMRAADELLLKSPDALMSGYAIEQLIESCVPAIRMPRLVAMPDLDVLLLAIRAATYGPKMEVQTKCPSCGEDNIFEADLPSILGTMQVLPPESPVRLSTDVIAYVRPYNIENGTRVSIAAFNETRKLQFADDKPDEVKNRMINESYRVITDLNVEMMADCVTHVIVPEGAVTNKLAIREFLANVPRAWSKKIEKTLKGLNEKGIDKTLHVCCAECKHEWKTELEFDPASFFGQSS